MSSAGRRSSLSDDDDDSGVSVHLHDVTVTRSSDDDVMCFDDDTRLSVTSAELATTSNVSGGVSSEQSVVDVSAELVAGWSLTTCVVQSAVSCPLGPHTSSAAVLLPLPTATSRSAPDADQPEDLSVRRTGARHVTDHVTSAGNNTAPGSGYLRAGKLLKQNTASTLAKSQRSQIEIQT